MTRVWFSSVTSIVFALSAGACSSDSPVSASTAGSAGTPAVAGTTNGGAAGAATNSGGAGQASVSGAAGAIAIGGTTTGGGSVGGADSTGGGAGSSGSVGQAGAGGEADPPGPLTLTSPVLTEGGTIDVKFRCTGDNVTPALDWTRGPATTQSYAVTQIHVASQSVHWVLWDISAATRILPEHIAREATPATPAGSKQVKPNIDGATWYGYTGPCPGSANQSYTFAVHALDVATLPGITPESTSTAAMAAVKAHQLAVASITVMASK